MGHSVHQVHHAPAHHAVHPAVHHAVHHAAPVHHAVHAGAAHPHINLGNGHHAVHHAAPYHIGPHGHGYEHRTINGQAESKSYGFTIVEPTEEARDAKAIDEAGADIENAIAILEEVAPVEEVVLEEVILEEAPL